MARVADGGKKEHKQLDLVVLIEQIGVFLRGQEQIPVVVELHVDRIVLFEMALALDSARYRN